MIICEAYTRTEEVRNSNKRLTHRYVEFGQHKWEDPDIIKKGLNNCCLSMEMKDRKWVKIFWTYRVRDTVLVKRVFLLMFNKKENIIDYDAEFDLVKTITLIDSYYVEQSVDSKRLIDTLIEEIGKIKQIDYKLAEGVLGGTEGLLEGICHE